MYIGRFAPSPTGPLHFGSLVTAVASYLDARSQAGEWHVRIEDIDTPRSIAGATDAIINALRKLGFSWDGEIVVQSQRASNPINLYAQAFAKLETQRKIYPCSCTRKEIADSLPNLVRHQELIYPGTCRVGLSEGKAVRAWRVRVEQTKTQFADHQSGQHNSDLTQEVGDFILRRADGIWAYQLAVVVDDAALGVTHVVRGKDLFTSTARQIYLQELLGYPRPKYWHIPLVYASNGEKLSKQNGAAPLDLSDPIQLLNQTLQHFSIATLPTDLDLESWWTEARCRWVNYRTACQR